MPLDRGKFFHAASNDHRIDVLFFSILLSFLIHLATFLPLREKISEFLIGGRSEQAKSVRVVNLSPSAYAGISKQAKAALQKAEAQQKRVELIKKEEKKEDKSSKSKGQIVEVAAPEDETAPEDARFLSKYNSRVKKETIARIEARDPHEKRVTNRLERRGSHAAEKDDGIQPNQAPAQPNQNPAMGEAKVQAKKGKAEGKDERFILEMPEMKAKDDVELRLTDLPGLHIQNRKGNETVEGKGDRFRFQISPGAEEGAENSKGKQPKTLDSLPTLSVFAPFPGSPGTRARVNGSPSRDHVDNVTEGDATFLNTKEFRYATFFYRVRDSVAMYWENLAASEYRRRDPSGNIYGVRDRATLLQIQLGQDGTLQDVRVAEPSGVDFLDDVAVQAFRLAQPFPNPPAGIRDEDGLIRFNFQFVVTMRHHGAMDLFR